MSLIGIDIGSSFVKGALLDPEGPAVRQIVREPFPDRESGKPPGHFEVSPKAIIAASEAVLRRLLEDAPECEAVFLAGQMGGVILTDHRGRPLSTGISWRDQRTLEPHPSKEGSYLDVVRRRAGAVDCERLGRELNPGASPSLLFYLSEQSRLPAGAVPLSIPGFVLQHLCGAACTGPTEAIGAIDLATGGWHREVFATLGLDGLAWPDLRDCRSPVGEYAFGGRRIPCFAAVGDHQCALLGALLREGELSINVSTGSQVSLLTPQWTPGDYQSRCFFDGLFLNTITHLPAGRALNLLVDLLSEISAAEGRSPDDPWAYITRAAAAAPETDLDVDLAFFSGPMGERGRIGNIGVENLSVGALFRAAFRNMAANYAIGAQRLSPDRRWNSLVFSGGLALKNPLLRQLIVERLNAPFRVCSSDEDVLRGLLVLGLVATGRQPSIDEAIARLRAADDATQK